MLGILSAIGWIACVVYATIPWFWLMIHPHASYWRSRSNSPYRLLLPMWMGMWLVCGLLTSPWRHVQFYRAPWSWFPAAVLFAAGLWIYKRSGAGFTAQQLAGLPEILEGHLEQRLVVSGIRSHVRHPIYLGHLCEMLAWTIGTGLAVCYALTVFAVLAGSIMVRMEDRELRKRFGNQYRQYQQEVPAILPRV
jgi:protein-S-isoprenylcysteine O-methyltransferase Ste14